MTSEDYEELVELLDGRIDELTKPIPSQQILRFAEALKSAKVGDLDSASTYGEEDYGNLLQAEAIVEEILPTILEGIRANSVDCNTGWQFADANQSIGDNGLCAIRDAPFQHFDWTTKVHTFDMHKGAYHGVCRDCVRNYAPLSFVERDDVNEWLEKNRKVSHTVESDKKREGQRIALIDAIRRHVHSTHYFSQIVQDAKSWIDGAFGEWR